MSRFARRPTAYLAVAMLASLGLLASGCGGSKSPSVASVATTASSNAAGGAAGSGSPTGQTQVQQDALKYARCMRSNGVPDFPDPSPSGGFFFQSGGGVDPFSPAFEAAQAKCRKLMPAGPAPGSTTHPSAQWLAHMIKVAECMRRHGVPDFPDPRTSVPENPFPAGSPGGVISDIDGVIFVFPASLDMQSPEFTQAAAACRFPLHNH
ncbi:MAG TPA: hypothetical protein VLW05_09785 [Gaiellaceae bacterium]|nr:hypothetical protein [Gaiellaceae bacterium]